MKIKYKAFIIIALTGLVFLTLTYFDVLRHPYLIFALLTTGAIFCMGGLLYVLIMRRIEKLNQSLTCLIESNELTTQLDISGKDEISSLCRLINELVYKCNVSHEQFEWSVQQYSHELQQTKESLQQEIIQQRTINTDFLTSLNKSTRLSGQDNLSTLPNPIYFNEILNKAINHAKRRNKLLALLLIDLNLASHSTLNKELNDKIITEMGKCFAGVLRSEDIISKSIGNEFMVLLNDIGKSKFASSVAEKLLQACAKPIKVDAHSFLLKASIGICIFPHDGNSLEDLLKNVDTALYKAKCVDQPAYQFYTHEMNIEAREYIRLETDLRQALARNELVLYYQPKLHLTQGHIIGVEALLRWEHPEYGIINPEKFISVAEETGMIMPIGEWALREACQMNKHWQDQGYEHLSVALNLSPKQFFHAELAPLVSKILTETKLDPSYLELEITEKTVMDNTLLTANVLNQLKSLGVQLSIDHFGTGYTSISHLKQFPISILKIDQTFIKGIPNNVDDVAIINAFIALAHNLGLTVIAEGVETAEQVQYLANQHCDMVQGYYLSYPLPADKVVLQFKKLLDEVLI